MELRKVLSGFSADEWSLAVSPSRLEALRQQVVKINSEMGMLRKNAARDKTMTVECEAAREEDRLKIHELRKEEMCARTHTGRSEGDDDVRACILAAVRAETETLVGEVARAAAELTARCRALKDLRASAKLARARRGTRVAAEECRRARTEHASCTSELRSYMEATASLRSRAQSLREEVGATEGEAMAAVVSGRAQLAVPTAAAAELRAKLLEETAAQKRSMATPMPDSDLLQRHMAKLAERLTEAQTDARRLAESLQDSEVCHEAQRRRLAEAGCVVEQEAAQSHAWDTNCALLELELRQQRSTTAAWRGGAEQLAASQADAARDVAQAAQAAREVLGGRCDLRGLRLG